LDQVNPTGLGLGRDEEDARYALKAQLQSLLIRLYPESLTLEPSETYPLLRFGRRDAKHVFVSALEADAAAWCRARMAAWEAPEQAAPFVAREARAIRAAAVKQAEALEEEGRYDEAIDAWIAERGAPSVLRAIELALDWLDDPERAAQILRSDGHRLSEDASRRETARVAVRMGRWREAILGLDPTSCADVWADIARAAWRDQEPAVVLRAARAAWNGGQAGIAALLAQAQLAVDQGVAPLLARLDAADLPSLRAAIAEIEALDPQHGALVDARRRVREMVVAEEVAYARSVAERREISSREAIRLRARSLAGQPVDAAWVAAFVDLPDEVRVLASAPASLRVFFEAAGPAQASRAWCLDAAGFVDGSAALDEGDFERAEAAFRALPTRVARLAGVREVIERATAGAENLREKRRREVEEAAARRSEQAARDEAARREAAVTADPLAYLRGEEREPGRVARALAAARRRYRWWTWREEEGPRRTLAGTMLGQQAMPHPVVLPDGRFVTFFGTRTAAFVAVCDPDGTMRWGHAFVSESAFRPDAVCIGSTCWMARGDQLVALDLDRHELVAVVGAGAFARRGEIGGGLYPWGSMFWVRTENRRGRPATETFTLIDPVARRPVKVRTDLFALEGGPTDNLIMREGGHLGRLTPDGDLDAEVYLGSGLGGFKCCCRVPGQPGVWALVSGGTRTGRMGLYRTVLADKPTPPRLLWEFPVADDHIMTMVGVGARILILSVRGVYTAGWWVDLRGDTAEVSSFRCMGAYTAIADPDGERTRLVVFEGERLTMIDPAEMPAPPRVGTHYATSLGLTLPCSQLLSLVPPDILKEAERLEKSPEPVRVRAVDEFRQRRPEAAIPLAARALPRQHRHFFDTASLDGRTVAELMVLADDAAKGGEGPRVLATLDAALRLGLPPTMAAHAHHLRALGLGYCGDLDGAEAALDAMEDAEHSLPKDSIRCSPGAKLGTWLADLRASAPDAPCPTEPLAAARHRMRSRLAGALRASAEGDHDTALAEASGIQSVAPAALAVRIAVALRAPTATLEQRLTACALAHALALDGEAIPGLDVGCTRRALAQASAAWMRALQAYLEGDGPAPVGSAWPIGVIEEG
jgi:hypothetical protein